MHTSCYSQGCYQVDDVKQRPRKAKASKKGDSDPVEVSQPPVTGNVIMPRQKQEGLEADVAGIGVETLIVADSVYNKELRCGAMVSLFRIFARLRKRPSTLVTHSYFCSECLIDEEC